MKAQEMGATFGWYNHFVLLAGGDYLKIGDVVDTPHREAFYNLCHKLESNR